MRILYIGHSHWNSGSVPFLGAHIAGARDSHLPQALAEAGLDVTVTTQPWGGSENGFPWGVHQVRLDRCVPGDYDALVVADHGGWLSVHGDWQQSESYLDSLCGPGTHHAWGKEVKKTAQPTKGWAFRDAVYAHPRLVCLVDGDPHHSAYRHWREYLSHAAAIGCTTAPMAALYRRELGKPVFLSTYGFSKVPTDLADPYPPGHKPIAFFCGRMVSNFFPVLRDLAQDQRFEVWLAALFMPNESPESVNGFGLPPGGKERLLPGVHFASDVAPWTIPGVGYAGDGPVGRPEIWPFLLHADVGINLVTPVYRGSGLESWRGWDANIAVLYCKLYDYLSAGLPVVTEPGAPNVGDVIALGAGRVVERERFADTIAAEVAKPRDRALIRNTAQIYGGWDVQARELARVLGVLP